MSKIKWIRKFKYLVLKYHLFNWVPSHKLSFMAHTKLLTQWISENKATYLTSFPDKHIDLGKRTEIYKCLIEKELNEDAFDYLEFGVSKGRSFRWWTENIKNPDTSFYGFDTFTGLPEDWGHFKKGDMSSGDHPPVIEDSRHTFFQGIFQDTLVKFLKDHDLNRRLVIHLDADLYSSTLYVLTTMAPYFKPGDILIFDEFNVPMHEFKAFHEWSSSFYIQYELLAEVNNYYQLAMKIK